MFSLSSLLSRNHGEALNAAFTASSKISNTAVMMASAVMMDDTLDTWFLMPLSEQNN
jgi:hypothetical protein